MDFLYSQLLVKPAYPTQFFHGQTVIVTGSNSGLGKEAVKHFARLGAAKIIVAVRNVSAGEAVRSEVDLSAPDRRPIIEVWQLDLGDYTSVKNFAKRAAKDLDRVDVLVENAGIGTNVKKLVEGHESTVIVNVISTFLLALLMLPQLQATAHKTGRPATISIVASEMHVCKFPELQSSSVFQALDAADDDTSMSERYMVTKLLEILVVRQLATRLSGTGVVINMLNPGLCRTEIARDAGRLVSLFMLALGRSAEVGSRTLVAAAGAGESSHGKYMTDGVIADHKLSPFARSKEGRQAGAKVWKELYQILHEISPEGLPNL